MLARAVELVARSTLPIGADRRRMSAYRREKMCDAAFVLENLINHGAMSENLVGTQPLTKHAASNRARVIVIGGGVAGGAAASSLAALGVDTVLFEPRCDAEHASRMKCCGHCLHGRSASSIAALGLERCVRASASAEIAFTSIECAHARPLRSPLALRGMVVRRDVLDPAILNHARTCGARIEPLSARFDASTRTVRASDGSVWSAELVIGADGISSRVARDAGLARTGEQGRRFGIAFDFPLENPAVAQLVDANTVHMLVAVGGYLGLVRDETSVHAAMLFDAGISVREAWMRLTRAFERLEAISPKALSAALENAGGAGPIPFRTRAASSEGLVLLGDAAGYIEPFTGDGMACAFEGAAILLNVVRASLSRGERDLSAVPARYEQQRRIAFAASERRCRRVAWLAARPRLLRAALRASTVSPALARALVTSATR